MFRWPACRGRRDPVICRREAGGILPCRRNGRFPITMVQAGTDSAPAGTKDVPRSVDSAEQAMRFAPAARVGTAMPAGPRAPARLAIERRQAANIRGVEPFSLLYEMFRDLPRVPGSRMWCHCIVPLRVAAEGGCGTPPDIRSVGEQGSDGGKMTQVGHKDQRAVA